MKRRDYVLRSLWLALAVGVPLGGARGQEEGETAATEESEGETTAQETAEDTTDYTGEGTGADSGAGGSPQRYLCTRSNYLYDPAEGDPRNAVPPGTPFAELPEDWICPDCGAPKAEFEPYSG
jgi:rubredoxin